LTSAFVLLIDFKSDDAEELVGAFGLGAGVVVCAPTTLMYESIVISVIEVITGLTRFEPNRVFLVIVLIGLFIGLLMGTLIGTLMGLLKLTKVIFVVEALGILQFPTH
jgi:thiamine transporter ThiT